MRSDILVVVGSLFGDEGKAKIVDCLSFKYDYVVKFQGGDNTGHSVVVGDEKIVFKLIPSGILRSNAVISQGVVLNPEALLNEIDLVRKHIDVSNKLFVSDCAHVIFDWNIAFDNLIENLKKDSKVGTTGRGIGPTYACKSLRIGARLKDLLDKENLRFIIEKSLMIFNPLFEKYQMPIFDVDASVEKYHSLAKNLSSYLVDTTIFLNKKIEDGKTLMFEGSQGLLLDLDSGTYPFVTSSSVVGALVSGTGLSCRHFTDVLGIVKVYSTRVGNGPFVTEIFDEELAQKIRTIGHEFGSVTGRNRRIGWMDLCAIKHGIKFSGITNIALTLVDVLNGFDEVYVCVEYKNKKSENSWEYEDYIEPVYKKFKGWNDDYSKLKTYEDFSIEFRDFVSYIEEFLDIRVAMISYGSRREELLCR